MYLNRSKTVLKPHKDAQKKNCRNPRDTQRCFNVYKMPIRRHLTLANTRSYDEILSVCRSVQKISSHTLIILLCRG